MHKFIEKGTITTVNGIKAAGIHCGLKKKNKDLALIISQYPCSAAGTFTLNKIVAAPVLISKEVIENKNKVRAILVNSGNANACTGEQGMKDALHTQQYLADKLNISKNEVIISATGVIGKQLPMDNILNGIDEIVSKTNVQSGKDAAEAIMTTDLVSKSFAVQVALDEGKIIIGGICKGSGMIMPNMATMLAFLATDAEIESDILQKLLVSSVKESFNKISVDGETSTNDMVILLANGASGIKIKEGTENYSRFLNGLLAITTEMAKAIANDGEGATKLIQVVAENTKTKEDADKIAKAISNSPLVKTALYGNDANWGRILSAAGNTGVNFNPANVTIKFGDLAVLLPNYKVMANEVKLTEALNKKEVKISIDLAEGDESSTWYTCDYTENYIKINSRYRT